MKFTVALTIAAALAVTGCATKRYPIATTAGATELSMLTCRDIAIELARAEQTRVQIQDTARTDWRSVAAWMVDGGFGNWMAKSDADKAVEARIMALRNEGTRQKCPAEERGASKAAL